MNPLPCLFQEIFHMAISRYIQQPDKNALLLHLLQWMPGQGYAVDSSTRSLILKHSHLFGRELIMELLSKQYMVLKTNKSREGKTKWIWTHYISGIHKTCYNLVHLYCNSLACFLSEKNFFPEDDLTCTLYLLNIFCEIIAYFICLMWRKKFKLRKFYVD